MTKLLITTLSAGALALGIAIPAAAGLVEPQGLVYAPKDCHVPKVEPHRIVIGCADFGVLLKRLHWSEWGGEKAKGEGRLLVNTCDPDCASGNFEEYDAKVTLLNIQPYACGAQTLNMYRRVHIRFPGDAPPHARGFRSNRLFCDE